MRIFLLYRFQKMCRCEIDNISRPRLAGIVENRTKTIWNSVKRAVLNITSIFSVSCFSRKCDFRDGVTTSKREDKVSFNVHLVTKRVVDVASFLVSRFMTF